MLDDMTPRIAEAVLATADCTEVAPRPKPARPGVLIASTTWWAFPARLAGACAARGLDVQAIAPPDNPMAKTRAKRRVFAYAPLRPLRALEQAMRDSQAGLVLPCDDRARAHLHRLHAATDDASIRATIETSLGNAAHYPLVRQRNELIVAARALGLAVPDSEPVEDAPGLQAALARIGLPAVLKVDGTWGGFGVAIVRSQAQACAAFARLSRPLSATRAIKRLLADRDAFDLPLALAREKPRLSLQSYVAGAPANSLSVCRDGRVLATICVKSLALQRPLGAAAVVQVIEHAGMRLAAEKLARRLDISGFLGLDFLLGEADGAAVLVEMNARATPLAHFCSGTGGDLVAGLAELAGGAAVPGTPLEAPRGIIAYFPQAWHMAPHSPYLTQGLHDVPWDEPELVRELLRLPHPDRGVLARVLRGARQCLRHRRTLPVQTQWDAA